MPQPSDPGASLEGRILAQRRVIAFLATGLTEDMRRELVDWLGERSVVQDGQEDPGAVPDAAFAVEQAMADELRQIKRLLDSDATANPSAGALS